MELEEKLKKLTKEEVDILRNKATERAFSGKFNDFKEKGVFICKLCESELFSSEKKYDSKSGWPSFFDVLNKDKVRLVPDTSHGMNRIEVICHNCESHLGHMFPDGPKPTGLRYCINSLSLDFKKS